MVGERYKDVELVLASDAHVPWGAPLPDVPVAGGVYDKRRSAWETLYRTLLEVCSALKQISSTGGMPRRRNF